MGQGQDLKEALAIKDADIVCEVNLPRATLLDARDTPELGGGYTWWVALFFNGSFSENPAV